jgi:hypothetical protein
MSRNRHCDATVHAPCCRLEKTCEKKGAEAGPFDSLKQGRITIGRDAA